MNTLSLPCAKCDVDVPEGSSSCPNCGASLASVVLAKERSGLTHTLIAKAVELRKSIPWATASAVVLLDDPDKPGKKKVRTGARNGALLLLLAAVGGAGLHAWTRPTEKEVVVLEVAASTPEIKAAATLAPLIEPPPTASSDAPAAAVAEKPALPSEAPAPPPAKPALAEKPAAVPAQAPAKKAPGTLVVVTRHKGKTLSNAVVRLNGMKLGGTPVNAKVAPGRYTVVIAKAGFKTEKRTDVEVRTSRKQTLTVDLKK